METIGDWGQMLFYSPAFTEHHLLEWLPLKTPNDPLFMPFAYAVYWGVHALLVLWLSQWVSARFGWSMLKSMIVLAIPVNYAWDFLVEGTATAMGWWTYDPGIGRVLEQRGPHHVALDHRHYVRVAQPDRLLGRQATNPGPQPLRTVLPIGTLHRAKGALAATLRW
nr:spirocyclase AveC family protein [Mycolicibacter kumamotonensis]